MSTLSARRHIARATAVPSAAVDGQGRARPDTAPNGAAGAASDAALGFLSVLFLSVRCRLVVN